MYLNDGQVSVLTSGGSKATIPHSETDFLSVAKNVQKYWSVSELKLGWTNADELLVKINDLATNTEKVRSIKANRRPVSREIKLLTAEIKSNLSSVRTAVKMKLGEENYDVYLPQLGFVHSSKGYYFPRNAESIIISLNQLIKGIAQLELSPYLYDEAYWQAMLEKFKTNVESSRKMAADISALVSQKLDLKNEIRKTLNSVVLLLKANYPDSYKHVLRSWEVQKERF